MKRLFTFFMAVMAACSLSFARTIYVDITLWSSDSPVFGVHVWGGAEAASYTLVQHMGNIYKADIRDDATNAIFLRKDASNVNPENVWQGEWNRSTTTLPANKNLYTVTSWSSGSSDETEHGEWGKYARTVYLDVTNWNATGAAYSVYVWNSNSGENAAYDLSLVSGALYSAEIRKDATNAIFLRKDASNVNPENVWQGEWNRSTTTVPADKDYYTVTSWSSWDEEKQQQDDNEHGEWALATTKVLSINNSLIDYNDQYAMFNSMSKAMGKDARWAKHTNLGQTLAYHYEEDPLTPNAKEVVAGVAWTHIILQEQSSLPRTDLQAFYNNVETWVTYIHANCPNPDVEIILPINWAYSDDAAFQTNNATLIANYKSVADDFNIKLCPVAIAYGNYQLDYPSTITADLYTDNRHPTATATYLACCLEYATIFGEDPSTITWKPNSVTDEMAARMRTYAQEAYEGTQRTEPQPQPQTAALVITDAIAHTENFNSLGTQDPSLSPVEAGKTAVAQACTLPQGWRIENNTTAARTIGSFANASETTTYIGGVSIVSNDKNGTWNFGPSAESTDRAVGGITSSTGGGCRTLNIMVHLLNDASEDFNTLTLSYDIEKYRNGANEAGFTVQLYTSANGVNWASAGSDFATVFEKDEDSNGAAVVPIATRNVTGSLECVFPQEGELYLAWSISATTGTDLAKSMALAIDNVSITPSFKTDIPNDAVILTSTAAVTEDFNSLGGADADPSKDTKTGINRASTLPTGWKIERNTSEPRQLNTYAAASDATMYIGGQSLASNAYNGTWNFGATGSSDRAVGGLTTGVDGGTRGINIMTRLYNNSGTEFKAIDLSYDIEKYRNGSNAAGFTVQLYTSADGATWTKASDDFKTSFTPDANNNGFASVPASTTQVSKTLNVVFPAYTSLYLAWNISVSSGTTCNAAPGLALDNVSITPKTSIPSNLEDVQNDRVQSTKLLRNGVLLIEKNGRIYNILGTEVK